MPSVRKAIIPAAGLGTRFLPATKAIPKEMLPIVDTPTIQLVVDEAVRAGITDIVVVNGRHKVAIEDHFDHAFELEHTLRERQHEELLASVERVSAMARLISVRQKSPLGLGHAVLCAREVIGDEPFAVLLGDDLIDNDERPGIGQLCQVYDETESGTIAVMEVPPGDEHLYGIIDGERVRSDGQPSDAFVSNSPQVGARYRVRDMVEKPAPGTAPSRLAVVGRYVLPPAVWPLLAATKPGRGGEIQLTDALRELAQRPSPGLLGVVLDGLRHDAGHKLGYLRANIAYALKRSEMRQPILAMLREFLADPAQSDP
ncbi:MAG: UTP--glucose-1-phosphate uridylyltransferase [Proteobacteria bacterium]|nr:UTP--glucose-1-phosphate uridylyltransferase [Pseudomonadota bacterium]